MTKRLALLALFLCGCLIADAGERPSWSDRGVFVFGPIVLDFRFQLEVLGHLSVNFRIVPTPATIAPTHGSWPSHSHDAARRRQIFALARSGKLERSQPKSYQCTG